MIIAVLLGNVGRLGAETPLAVPIDGAVFEAALTRVDAAWQITFSSGEKERTLPAGELVTWGTLAETGQEPAIVLTDGSLLVGEVVETDKGRLTADSGIFGPVTLPVEMVAGVVFHPPVERHARDLLVDDVAGAQGNVDRVMLVNGDQLTGRLDTIRDNTVRLVTDVGPIDVKTERIRALVFNPLLATRPTRTGLHAVVGMRNGTRLVTQQLVVDEASLRLTGPDGTAWTGSPSDLVFLQPLEGRAVYLSDLKVAAYRYVPYLTLTWPYHTDRNATGSMLRAGGRLYLKGLGMHSASRLTYMLAEPYRRFQAELAIDDSTGNRGSVRFRVFVDGREKYTLPAVRGGTSPVPISVDLAGAKRLDLVVEYADRADELDHANWLQARLIR